MTNRSTPGIATRDFARDLFIRTAVGWEEGERPTKTPSFPVEVLDQYVPYLESPHSHGYWRLIGTWRDDSPFHRALIDKMLLVESLSPSEQASEAKTEDLLVQRARTAQRREELSRTFTTFFGVLNYVARQLQDSKDVVKYSSEYCGPNGEPYVTAQELQAAVPSLVRDFQEKIWTPRFNLT